MFRLPTLFTILAFTLLSVPADAETGVAAGVGTIKSLTGDVQIIRAGPVAAQVGDRLAANDIIQVGSGTVGLTFLDGTRVSLGPKTRFKISQFQFNPVDGQLGMILRLVTGKLQYISGKIADLAPDSVKVETPVATIGVRGTRFIVEAR